MYLERERERLDRREFMVPQMLADPEPTECFMTHQYSLEKQSVTRGIVDDSESGQRIVNMFSDLGLTVAMQKPTMNNPRNAVIIGSCEEHEVLLRAISIEIMRNLGYISRGLINKSLGEIAPESPQP